MSSEINAMRLQDVIYPMNDGKVKEGQQQTQKFLQLVSNYLHSYDNSNFTCIAYFIQRLKLKVLFMPAPKSNTS